MLTNKRPGELLEGDFSKQSRLLHPDVSRPGPSSVSGNSAATQSAGNQAHITEDTAVDSAPQHEPKLEPVHEFLNEAPVLAHPQHLGHELLFQPELPQHVSEAMGAASVAVQLLAPPHQLPLADSGEPQHSSGHHHDSQHHLSSEHHPALPQAGALHMEAPGISQADGLMYDLSQPNSGLMMPSIVAAALQVNTGSELPPEAQPEPSFQDAMADTADRPFKCPEPGCGFASKRKSNLTVHSRIHTRPRPPRRCRHPGCEFVAGEGCNLKEHQRMHAGEKPYRCSEEGCDASFARVDHLTVHMRTHTGEKPYMCTHPGCNFAAAQQSNLHRHMQSHSAEKPYKCTEPGCSAAFSQSSNLVRHQRAHRGEKRFHCTHPGCNFAAAQLANVKRHMQAHTGERPYHCDHEGCQSAFSQLANLVRHKRIHTAEKPFKCDQEGCSYCAAQRSNLQRHMQTAHNLPAPADRNQAMPLPGDPAAMPLGTDHAAMQQLDQTGPMLPDRADFSQTPGPMGHAPILGAAHGHVLPLEQAQAPLVQHQPVGHGQVMSHAQQSGEAAGVLPA